MSWSLDFRSDTARRTFSTGFDFGRNGALVTLLGPSGCGKTTLLRLIAGLVNPDEGSVSIAGMDVTGRRRTSATVGVVPKLCALPQPDRLRPMSASACRGAAPPRYRRGQG